MVGRAGRALYGHRAGSPGPRPLDTSLLEGSCSEKWLAPSLHSWINWEWVESAPSDTTRLAELHDLAV